MKKAFMFLSLLFLLLISEQKSLTVSAASVNAVSVEITSTSTLSDDNEHNAFNGDTYNVIKDNVIRIHYETSSTEYDGICSLNQSYGSIINHESLITSNGYTGYYDVQLNFAGQMVILINIEDRITQSVLTYDYINITIYESAESIELSTTNPIGFLNKNLIISFTINNDQTVFLPNIYLYYYNNQNEKIIFLNNLGSHNEFVVKIDDVLLAYDSITFYATDDNIISSPLLITMSEISYLEYFDLMDDDLKFCIDDEEVSFYARIPLYTTPDFVLIDNTDTVRLLSYSISEHADTYDIVEFQIRLLQVNACEVLIGTLSYNDYSNLNYVYQQLSIEVIDTITSIQLEQLDTISYGDIVLIQPLVNEKNDVECNLKWYIDETLIYTGPALNYQFYNSGSHILKVEYGDVVTSLTIFVAYSNTASIIWFVVFIFGIIFGVMALMFMMHKNKKGKLYPFMKKRDEIGKLVEEILIETNEKKIHQCVHKLKEFKNNINILNDSSDDLSIDVAVEKLNQLVVLLNNVIKAREEKSEKMKNKIDLLMKDILSSLDNAYLLDLHHEQVEEIE